MAITLDETAESRAASMGDDGSVTLKYILEGTADDAAAKLAAASSTPASYSGLARQTIDVEPITVDSVSNTGSWAVTVKYGTKPAPGGVSIQFETSGGSQHITQSKSTSGSYAPTGQTAPDFKGAIGVTADSVEGVDIVVPVLNLTVTKVWPTGSLPSPATIYALTGKVNSGSFTVTDSVTCLTITLAVGECLFNGAHFGSQRSDGGVEVSYAFAGSPNRTGLTVGDITGIAKKGWEYMWVRYQDAEDATAKAIVKKPIAVKVEKVYDDGDFAGLGL